AYPFVSLTLFKNSAYSLTLIVTFLTASLLFALTFAMPLLLHDVHHLSQLKIGLVLFPSAIIAALLGKRGGRLADKKGNTYLFYLSTSLLAFCYVLLAIFVESTFIFWIAIILIFGNVGATFIRVALSNAISRTLPKDSIGIGMGFFSMLNFIAGAVATTSIGVLIEKEVTIFDSVSFIHSNAAIGYSNIFILLIFISIIISVIFPLISKNLQ